MQSFQLAFEFTEVYLLRAICIEHCEDHAEVHILGPDIVFKFGFSRDKFVMVYFKRDAVVNFERVARVVDRVVCCVSALMSWLQRNREKLIVSWEQV